MKNAMLILFILFILLLSITFSSCDCDKGDEKDKDSEDNEGDSDDDDSTDDDSSFNITCYRDQDNDGFGNPNATIQMEDECNAGWVLNKDDCNDTDKYSNPNGIELPDDGIDQDCMDGDFTASDENGIFVSPTGLDGATGKKIDPMNSLVEAVAEAKNTNRSVFVAAGSYYEVVDTKVSMYGGYNSTFSYRDIENNLTSILGNDEASLAIMQDEYAVINGFIINGAMAMTTSMAVAVAGTAILIDNDILGFSGCQESYGIFAAYSAVLKAYKNRISGGGGSNESTAIATKMGPYIFLADNEIDGGSGNISIGIDIDTSTANIVDNEISGGTGYNAFAVASTDGELTLNNNDIHGGYSLKSSGSKANASVGLKINGGSAHVYGNVFHGGESNVTTAISGNANDLILDANTIYGGKATSESTGVNCYHKAIMTNNYIDGGYNTTGVSSAVQLQDGDYTLVNNTLNGGKGDFGIGIYLNNATLYAVNNIIDGGDAATISTGISVHVNGGNLSLINNDIYGESLDRLLVGVAILISDITDLNDCANWAALCVESKNNISENPNFLDPLHGDYHIGSVACVDSGTDPSLWYSGEQIGYDFEGDKRPTGDGWDIGMDEKSP